MTDAGSNCVVSPTPEDIRDALGCDPIGFVEEAREWLSVMPPVIQRDYLKQALDKIERVAKIMKEV